MNMCGFLDVESYYDCIAHASGEGEQERWFGEKGRHKSSEMENGS